jgi:hypothetical protein
MRPVRHPSARRAWLLGPWLINLAACPPASLDPVVSTGPQASDSTGDPSNSSLSASSDGPTTDTPGPTTGTGEPSPSTGADPVPGSTTGALDETTGTPDTSASSTTTGAPDPSASTAVDPSESDTSTTDPTPDTTGTGTTGADDDSTGAAMLDPCPIDQPLMGSVSGTTPAGPFTAVTGVFHFEIGPGSHLQMNFLPEVPPLPWDFDLSFAPQFGIGISGEGQEPEFWLGDRKAIFWHHNGMDFVDLKAQPIEITLDTLEVWSFEWSDYDVTTLLGGNFSLVGDGWDIAGEFIVPYCHPMSELHPI